MDRFRPIVTKRIVVFSIAGLFGITTIGGAFGQTPIDELPPGIQWYTSDADMIRRGAGGPFAPGEVEPEENEPEAKAPEQFEPEEIEWALAVRDSDSQDGGTVERLFLYHYGEFWGAEVVRYNAAGLPIERHRLDQEGETQFVETLRYRPDGTLRETRRCDPDDACTTITFGLPGKGWSERIDDDDFVLLREFDPLGRPIYTRRESQETEEIWEEWLTYEDGVLQERIVLNADVKTTTTYDGGRAVGETTEENGRLLETVARRFDDEGRLLYQQTVARDTTTTETWSYDEDGGWEMERRRNGVLLLRSWRDAGDSGRTTRYRDGRAVMREIYEAGVAVRREIISDGSVVRVEEL